MQIAADHETLGLQVLGITDAPADEVARFCDEQVLPFPVLADAEAVRAAFGVGMIWGSPTFLVDGEAPALAAASPAAPGDDTLGRGRLNSDLRNVEEQMILDALRNGNGSRKQAAEILGISPRTLRHKLQKLREAGISIPRS